MNSLERAMADRGTDKKRPLNQRQARRLTQTARNPYRQDQRPNAAYPSPGRGVSGESSN